MRFEGRRLLAIPAGIALASALVFCSPFDAEPVPPETTPPDAAASVEGGDPADGSPRDGGSDRDARRRPKRAFVSSAEYKGALGADPSGWDALCARLAQDAGLHVEGEFVAWLSTADALAVARLGDEEREWFDVKGTLVASGKVPLGPAIALGIDEKGKVVQVGGNVWTGTFADGGPTSLNCNGWTTDAEGVQGAYGEVGGTAETWSRKNTENCDSSNRIYCFEK